MAPTLNIIISYSSSLIRPLALDALDAWRQSSVNRSCVAVVNSATMLLAAKSYFSSPILSKKREGQPAISTFLTILAAGRLAQILDSVTG